MSKVEVLLSTYNGLMYLEQQLYSLSRQEDVDLRLSIRDDGSSDGTPLLLSTYLQHPFCELSVVLGDNIGVIRSFFELLSQAGVDAEYYAFCDQDDVWKPDKLSRATTMLKDIPSSVPAMYCSRTELVDKDLNVLNLWPSELRKAASLHNAIVENVAVGCTVVINRAAKDLILSRLPDVSRVIMHDWWIYLCVSAFGKVIFDPLPSLQYRQHGSNVFGGDQGGIRKWSKKWGNFQKNLNKRLLRKQAEEFYRLFGDHLSEGPKHSIERFLRENGSLPSRIKFIITTDLYRQNKLEHFIFKMLYLSNKI